MGEHVYICDVAKHEGQKVTIKGWLYNRRDKGRLQFLILRDGTGIIQGVALQSEMATEAFAAASKVTQESSVIAAGAVRADDRAPGCSCRFPIRASCAGRRNCLSNVSRLQAPKRGFPRRCPS